MNGLIAFPSSREIAVGMASLVGALISTPAVHAQAPTVVQLPTFHFFSISTTVSVPDGGDAFLGGIGLNSSGRVERGIPGLPSQPFTNVATGSSTGAAMASVHAEIQDLEAMDRAVLATAASLGADGSLALSGPKPINHPNGGPLESVAAIRAENAAEDDAHEKAAAENLAQARQLMGEGKTSVAKVFLHSAVSKSAANSDTHRQAIAALKGIEQAKSSAQLAGK